MQEEKRVVSPENIFCGMPFIQSYFKDLDGKIRSLKGKEGCEAELATLKKKRSDLYETARYMGA